MDPKELSHEISVLKGEKATAYWERNQLVLALSKIYPSWLGRDEETDESWEKDWMNIVFVEIPAKEVAKWMPGAPEYRTTHQLSWHIQDKELVNFSHLEYDRKRKWDGHTTEEKYRRLRHLHVGPMTKFLNR